MINDESLHIIPCSGLKPGVIRLTYEVGWNLKHAQGISSLYFLNPLLK